jgi:hypothetical protein
LNTEHVSTGENLVGKENLVENLIRTKSLDAMKNTFLVIPHRPLKRILDDSQKKIPSNNRENNERKDFMKRKGRIRN